MTKRRQNCQIEKVKLFDFLISKIEDSEVFDV